MIFNHMNERYLNLVKVKVKKHCAQPKDMWGLGCMYLKSKSKSTKRGLYT